MAQKRDTSDLHEAFANKQHINLFDDMLEPVQREVMQHLTMIFPNFDQKVLRTSVCHPSNLCRPLVLQTLLHQCIDDLLAGRTAVEADHYGQWHNNNNETGPSKEIQGNFDDCSTTSDSSDNDIRESNLELNLNAQFHTRHINNGSNAQLNVPMTVRNENVKIEAGKLQLNQNNIEKSFHLRVSPDLNYRVQNDGTDLYSRVNDLIYGENFKVLEPKTICSATSIGNTVVTNFCNSHSILTTTSTVSSFEDKFKYSNIQSSDSDSLSASSPSSSSSSDNELPEIEFSKKIRNQHNIIPSQNALSKIKSTFVGLDYFSQIPRISAVASVSNSHHSSPVKLAPSKFNLAHLHEQEAKGTDSINLKSNFYATPSSATNVNRQTPCVANKFSNIRSEITYAAPILQDVVIHQSVVDPTSPASNRNMIVLDFQQYRSSKSKPRKEPRLVKCQYCKETFDHSVILNHHFACHQDQINSNKLSHPDTAAAVRTCATRSIMHEKRKDRVKAEPKEATPAVSSAILSVLLTDTASQKSASLLLKPSKFELASSQVFAVVKQDGMIMDQTLSSKGVKRSYGHPQTVSASCSTTIRKPVSLLATASLATVSLATASLATASLATASLATASLATEIFSKSHIKAPEHLMQQTQNVENIKSCKQVTPVLQQKIQSITTAIPIMSVPAPVLEDPAASIKTQVLELFPDVDPHHLDVLCGKYIGLTALNDICFELIETKYPKLEQNPAAVVKLNETDTLDYSDNYTFIPKQDNLFSTYAAQVSQLLAQEFKWISYRDIRNIMQMYKQQYTPSHRQLTSIWQQVNDVVVKKSMHSNQPVSYRGLSLEIQLSDDIYHNISSPQMVPQRTCSLCLLKNKRPVVKQKYDLLTELQCEVDSIKQKLAENMAVSLQEADHQVATVINDQEYEVEGQCIECGCCYGEYPFEKIVQCYDGHLFCDSCLVSYVREVVFGQGKVDLKCMTDLCDASFPKSQLTKALPAEILMKYEDRVTEENLNLADFGDLVKCPHCDFRAFMDPLDKVLRCQSDKCRKETCRYCQVDWTEHFGKRCNEVEKNDETKLRLQYEEKMTMAKVRTCPRCKAQFMKEDGCNKMTCRCGAKMCYICRTPDIDYKHFCQHVREPGHGCSECDVCSLWTNPAEDDDRAIKEIQKKALEDRKNRGFTEDRLIGVPDFEEPPTKRVKK